MCSGVVHGCASAMAMSINVCGDCCGHAKRLDDLDDDDDLRPALVHACLWLSCQPRRADCMHASASMPVIVVRLCAVCSQRMHVPKDKLLTSLPELPASAPPRLVKSRVSRHMDACTKQPGPGYKPIPHSTCPSSHMLTLHAPCFRSVHRRCPAPAVEATWLCPAAAEAHRGASMHGEGLPLRL